MEESSPLSATHTYTHTHTHSHIHTLSYSHTNSLALTHTLAYTPPRAPQQLRCSREPPRDLKQRSGLQVTNYTASKTHQPQKPVTWQRFLYQRTGKPQSFPGGLSRGQRRRSFLRMITLKTVWDAWEDPIPRWRLLDISSVTKRWSLCAFAAMNRQQRIRTRQHSEPQHFHVLFIWKWVMQ